MAYRPETYAPGTYRRHGVESVIGDVSLTLYSHFVRVIGRDAPPPAVNGSAADAATDPADGVDGRDPGGSAHFGLSRRLRGDEDPHTLAASVLEYLGSVHAASAGAFYLVRPGQRFVLAAEFGHSRFGPPARTLRLGQGLLGRAAAGDRIRIVSDTPGPDGPCHRILAPFCRAGRTIGLMQLERGGVANGADLEFLRLSAESVAVALDSAHSRARVERLLDATRRQAKKLARQQRELKASNVELERADRYKSEFLANMSHELRTPLNSMLIMSQVLAENRRGNLDDDEVEAAATINKAGGELLMIINDILDLTRVEAGKLDLQLEFVDPRALTADLVDLFRPVAENQGLEFARVVEPDTPAMLQTDPLRVTQILKNLLSNAFKFTRQGKITLTVRRTRACECVVEGADDRCWVAFEVADTGIGMNAETAARVFDAFNQGDGSIARRHGGSGLGLSISNRLAELLGGRIAVTSEEGRGSTFVLALPESGGFALPGENSPIAAAAAADDGIEGRWAECLAGCTVLLADDDMRTVYGLSHLLNAMGANVWIARHAAEALELAERDPGHGLLCVSPHLFADREQDLKRLVVGDGSRQRPPCLWLGDEPGAATWLPEDVVVLEKPLDAARIAAACSALREGEVQRV